MPLSTILRSMSSRSRFRAPAHQPVALGHGLTGATWLHSMTAIASRMGTMTDRTHILRSVICKGENMAYNFPSQTPRAVTTRPST